MKQLQYKEVTYQIHLAGARRSNKLLHVVYTLYNNNLEFSTYIDANTNKFLILESLCNNIEYIVDG